MYSTTMGTAPAAVGGLAPRPRFNAVKIANAVAGAMAMGLLTLSTAMTDNGSQESAQNSSSPPESTFAPRRETAFGAYLGAPYHYPSDFWLKKEEDTDLKIKDVHWYTMPFNNPIYYGARIQRWGEAGAFGTMLDFTHSKAYAPLDDEHTFEGTLDGAPAPDKAVIRNYFGKLEWSHGHNMLTLNGLARLFTIGRFSAYAGGGAGVSLPHSEIHLKSDPARTYEYQYAGPCAQALFGIELRTRTGTVFFEYKFTFADYSGPLTERDGTWLPIDLYRQVSRWWSGEAPPGGFAGAKLASHQLIGGFTARFAPTAK